LNPWLRPFWADARADGVRPRRTVRAGMTNWHHSDVAEASPRGRSVPASAAPSRAWPKRPGVAEASPLRRHHLSVAVASPLRRWFPWFRARRARCTRPWPKRPRFGGTIQGVAEASRRGRSVPASAAPSRDLLSLHLLTLPPKPEASATPGRSPTALPPSRTRRKRTARGFSPWKQRPSIRRSVLEGRGITHGPSCSAGIRQIGAGPERYEVWPPMAAETLDFLRASSPPRLRRARLPGPEGPGCLLGSPPATSVGRDPRARPGPPPKNPGDP